MAVIEYFPNHTTVNDGEILRQGADLTWADIHDGAGTGFLQTGSYMTSGWAADGTTNTFAVFYRTHICFDTTLLPAGATITAATIKIKVKNNYNAFAIPLTYGFYASTLADPAQFAITDYQLCGTTLLSDAKSYLDLVEDPYIWNTFTLNAAGRAQITKAGISKFCLREATYDATNTVPEWKYANEWRYVIWYTQNPTLTVTFNLQYPSDTMTRVTGLVHRYSPGNYSLEVFLGDTKTDWDTSKPEIAKPSATLPKREPRAYDVTPEGELVPRPEFPTYMKPSTPTAEEMEEYAGMGQVEYNKIIRQNAIQRALKEFGPITGPEDLKRFTTKYPSLRIGQGIPKIGTPEYARWMLGIKTLGKTAHYDLWDTEHRYPTYY